MHTMSNPVVTNWIFITTPTWQLHRQTFLMLNSEYFTSCYGKFARWVAELRYQSPLDLARGTSGYVIEATPPPVIFKELLATNF